MYRNEPELAAMGYLLEVWASVSLCESQMRTCMPSMHVLPFAVDTSVHGVLGRHGRTRETPARVPQRGSRMYCTVYNVQAALLDDAGMRDACEEALHAASLFGRARVVQVERDVRLRL